MPWRERLGVGTNPKGLYLHSRSGEGESQSVLLRSTLTTEQSQ